MIPLATARVRIAASAVALACGAGLAGLPVATALGSQSRLPRMAPTTSGWRVATTFSRHFPIVTALTAPAANNIWAMGTGSLRPGGGTFPVGRHWNGRSWSAVTFPAAIAHTGIGCAGASSATNIWAFAGTSMWGNFAAAAGALRLEHGRWVQVKKFPAGIVTNCLVLSPSEIWVFGDAHVAPGTGTWHLHGSTWTQIVTNGYALDAASAVSPDNVWGLGEDGFLRAVLARWNGHSWTRVSLPSRLVPSTAGPAGINAVSAANVWLALRTSSRALLVLHWNGTTWQKVGSSNPGYYLPLAVHSRSGWWADTASFLAPGSVLHRVNNHWITVPVHAGCPAVPFQLAAVGGSATILGLQLCNKPSLHSNVLANGPLR